MTKSAILSAARTAALEMFGIPSSEDAYQTGTGSFDVLVTVDTPDGPVEVPVTLKAQAHDVIGDKARAADYDMFQAHEDYKAEAAQREAKAKAVAEKKAKAQADREAAIAARAAKKSSKS